MGKLEEKVALITGGTTGIGLATAKLFQREGAQVAITGVNPETLKAAAKELGPTAAVIRSDTGNLGDITNLAEEMRKRFGRTDVLFANAGIGGGIMPIQDATEAAFDNVFNVNVKGLYFTVQKVLPLMPDGAAIVLNSSIAETKGFLGVSMYSATKAAVRSFGRTLAAELAPRGIRVNTISPGTIDTPMVEKVNIRVEQARAWLDGIAASTLLKRKGKAEEVAQVALFLASLSSSYITAAELIVDGGFVDV